MVRISILALLFALSAIGNPSLHAEGFKSKSAKAAKAEFERTLKQLDKEHELHRQKLLEMYRANLELARAESLKKGDLKEAQKILAEEKLAAKGDALKTPRVIALWSRKKRGTDQTPELLAFRSDGILITGWGAKGTWRYSKKTLEERFSDSNAPGGVGVNTHKLSEDGVAFLGSNNVGTKFEGKLLYGAFDRKRGEP